MKAGERSVVAPIGKIFGEWTVIADAPRVNGHTIVWVCRCSCGTERTVEAHRLRHGKAISCGCKKAELVSAAMTRHGHTKRVGNAGPTLTWNSWTAMRKRCLDKNCKDYVRYGAVGITVCDRWLIFDNFLADMGERPVGTTLDRIDGSKGYVVGNCRWSSPIEQIANRKNTVWLTIDGVRKTLAEWARQSGLRRGNLTQRIARLGGTKMPPRAVLLNDRNWRNQCQ